MKYYLANYQLGAVPQETFAAPRIEEISLKVLEYVAKNDVQSMADMPALPLVLTSEVREILPKDVANLYRPVKVKGACYWKILSLYDDIYRVKINDEYDVIEGIRVVW